MLGTFCNIQFIFLAKVGNWMRADLTKTGHKTGFTIQLRDSNSFIGAKTECKLKKSYRKLKIWFFEFKRSSLWCKVSRVALALTGPNLSPFRLVYSRRCFLEHTGSDPKEKSNIRYFLPKTYEANLEQQFLLGKSLEGLNLGPYGPERTLLTTRWTKQQWQHFHLKATKACK